MKIKRLVLCFLMLFLLALPMLSYAADEGVLGNKRWKVDENGDLLPWATGTYSIGSSSYEVEDIYADQITLNGSAITSWGEVVSPWSDNGTYISPTGAPTVIKAYLNGNFVITGDMDADSYIMENDAQLDNASNNTVTLTENSDILTVSFDGDDIQLQASDGSIEFYPQADATEGTVEFFTGGDTDDYIAISTSSNQPLINFVGCNGKITAASGTIDFDDEAITTTGAVSLGATTVTSVIIGDDTYDVVVDDEHRFTSNDSDVVVESYATTDKDALFQLTSDASTDNGDEWQLKNDDGDSNNLLFINDTSGSLATIMTLSTGGVLTMTSNIVLQEAEVIDNSTDDTVQIRSNDSNTTVQLLGYEAMDAILTLSADQSDDNGDDWSIKNEADDNALEFITDASGSSVVAMYLDTNSKLHIGGGLSVCGTTGLSGDVNMYQTDLTITDATLGDSLTFDTSAGDLYVAGDFEMGGAIQVSGSDVMTFSANGACLIGSLSNTGSLYLGQYFYAANLKSGADQSAAGASAGEVYVDTDDNTLKLGT